MSNKILRVFLNVNLSAGHQKLTEFAKEAGIKTNEIGKGEYVIFINCARDKIKLYAAAETIAYHKLARGRKIDMRVIRELPSVFNGKEINYDMALKRVVEEALTKKTKTIQVI